MLQKLSRIVEKNKKSITCWYILTVIQQYVWWLREMICFRKEAVASMEDNMAVYREQIKVQIKIKFVWIMKKKKIFFYSIFSFNRLNVKSLKYSEKSLRTFQRNLQNFAKMFPAKMILRKNFLKFSWKFHQENWVDENSQNILHI